MSTNDTLKALADASAGLTYQSESDEPFEPFTWGKAEGELDAAVVRKRLKKGAKTPVEEITPDEFFEPLTTGEDWHGDEEKAIVEQFKKLRGVVKKTLAGAKVFKVGKTKVAIYIVGKTDEGDRAGLSTTAVET